MTVWKKCLCLFTLKASFEKFSSTILQKPGWAMTPETYVCNKAITVYWSLIWYPESYMYFCDSLLWSFRLDSSPNGFIIPNEIGSWLSFVSYLYSCLQNASDSKTLNKYLFKDNCSLRLIIKCHQKGFHM